MHATAKEDAASGEEDAGAGASAAAGSGRFKRPPKSEERERKGELESLRYRGVRSALLGRGSLARVPSHVQHGARSRTSDLSSCPGAYDYLCCASKVLLGTHVPSIDT